MTLVTSTAILPVPAVADSPQTLAAAQASVNANLNSLNQQAGELNGQVSDLNQTIAGLDADRAALEPQVAEKEAALREILKDSYIAGNPSSFDILAGNQTFSGAVGQQQYRDEVSQKVHNMAQDLLNTKKELDSKIAEAQQKRDGLATLQGQLQQKIDTATAQQQAQEQLAKMNEQQYQQAKQAADQQDLGSVAAPSSSPSSSPGPVQGVHGDNPYPWGQCTWYVYSVTGRGQMGNAGTWSGSANGGVGSILIMPPGVGGASGAGHVGIVVGKGANGITIRDSNWVGLGVISTHTVPNSSSYRYY